LKDTSWAPESQGLDVARAAGIISLGNAASRVMGVIREITKAGLFGATGSVGALEVAMRVPTLVYDLLIGGMLHSALVPVFSDYVAAEHRGELWRLVSTLLCLTVAVLSGFVLVGEMLAPQIVWVMAGGLDENLQAEAASLLRIMLPAIVFLNVAGVIAGVLYALKRFALPAFSAAAYNAAVVVVSLVLGRRLGTTGVAIGVLLGAVLQVLLQLPGLRDARLLVLVDLRHRFLRKLRGLYLPIAIGLIVDMIGVAMSYNLASRTGRESIAWMQYSATLIQFPLGLVSLAVSGAILPTLSRHAASSEAEPFRHTLVQGLRLVLALTIPATVGLWVLSVPIVQLVFEHGDFGPSDTVATVAALRCHLIGLIFAAVDYPLIFTFYARKDTWTPAAVGMVTVGLYVALALGSALVTPLTLNALVLANSVKLAIHALLMLLLLRRRVGRLGGREVGKLILKAAVSSAVMSVAVNGTYVALRPISPAGVLGEMLGVGIPGLVGLVTYAVFAILLRMQEMRVLVRTVPRRA
jgi:putative peptidoglycan lipid II flippase